MRPLVFSWPYAAPFWVIYVWAFVPEFRIVAQARRTVAANRAKDSGIAVLVAGSLLRRHCFRVLGRYFTGDVQVQRDQPVITGGAYRWVRHPSYTGGILMFTGIGLALANWVSLATLAFVAVFVYVYRVRAEERALVATLGEPYRQYMKTSKRFVPFVV